MSLSLILIKVTFDTLFYPERPEENFPMEAIMSRARGTLQGSIEANYRFGAVESMEYLLAFVFCPSEGWRITRINEDGTHYDIAEQLLEEPYTLSYFRPIRPGHRTESIFDIANELGLIFGPSLNLKPNRRA